MYVVEKNVPVIPHIRRGNCSGNRGGGKPKSAFRQQLEKLKVNESFAFIAKTKSDYAKAGHIAYTVRKDLGLNIVLRTEGYSNTARYMRAYCLPAVKAKNALAK